MKILIVSATGFEIAPLQLLLAEHFENTQPYHYKKEGLEVYLLITGVGMTATAYALGQIFAQNTIFDWVINVGIAGAFNRELAIGDVVQVVSDRFGDLGVEEADGRFTDVFEMGLMDGKSVPFEDNALAMEGTPLKTLKSAKAITVNKVHGYEPSIERIRAKYAVDIETMEGAAFFYACKQAKVPFLQIRSISNYVEKRNRENWNLPLAIDRLNVIVWGIIQSCKTV